MALIYEERFVILVCIEVKVRKWQSCENNCLHGCWQRFEVLHNSVSTFHADHSLNSRHCFVWRVQDSHFVFLYTVEVHLANLLVGEDLYVSIAVERLRDRVVDYALVFLQIGSHFEQHTRYSLCKNVTHGFTYRLQRVLDCCELLRQCYAYVYAPVLDIIADSYKYNFVLVRGQQVFGE